MDDLQKTIKARKDLLRKARSKARKGLSGSQFDRFIRSICPQRIQTIGEKEFRHLIAYTFN